MVTSSTLAPRAPGKLSRVKSSAAVAFAACLASLINLAVKIDVPDGASYLWL